MLMRSRNIERLQTDNVSISFHTRNLIPVQFTNRRFYVILVSGKFTCFLEINIWYILNYNSGINRQQIGKDLFQGKCNVHPN